MEQVHKYGSLVEVLFLFARQANDNAIATDHDKIGMAHFISRAVGEDQTKRHKGMLPDAPARSVRVITGYLGWIPW